MVSGPILFLYSENPAQAHSITIKVPNDDTLVGWYYPKVVASFESPETTTIQPQVKGVIFLEGFGSDQTAMQPMVNYFVGKGFDVLTFDFSGHGRSPGGLDFDNAQTDRLALQVLAAKEKFKALTNLDDQEIAYVGHSLGARVGLQAASMDDNPPGALVLLGTQVNLSTNVQSEFFTGTSDADLEWVQALGPENPGSEIWLISGEWDDILTPDAASLLATKLITREHISHESLDDHSSEEEEPIFRRLIIRDGVLHNYEIYMQGLFWNSLILELRWGVPVATNITIRDMTPTPLFWIIAILGLFLSITGVSRLLPEETTAPQEARVLNFRRYLWGKLGLWLVAIPFAVIIVSAIFFAPVGTPVFNLIYIGFIGGYGTLLVILYTKERMPGVEGRLRLRGNPPTNWLGILWGLLAFGVLLFLTAALARTGWFFVFPFNQRFIWLVMFTPITALGFVIGLKEMEMLKASQPENRSAVALNTLIGLFPFFLYTSFLAALGSISGVVGGVQGLVILALALVSQNLILKLSKRPWLAALCAAFLLYWLILPQGVLFR
jgi:pimeloyl-ACP methyl ester carboxylesterase